VEVAEGVDGQEVQAVEEVVAKEQTLQVPSLLQLKEQHEKMK